MTDILQKILQRKAEEVAALKTAQSTADMRAKLADVPPTRDFAAALHGKMAAGQPAVIAEIKRASPSKGLLREPFAPDHIAADYARHGAACLSVLTDRDFFQGDPEHLKQAKAACDLPILRKDFVIDGHQIDEARVMGADAILLIVAALSATQLREFCEQALALGLAVLVEVHDGAELDMALALPEQTVLGVNNRNLRTFETTLSTSCDLRGRVPHRLLVAESGILTRGDVAFLRAAQIHAFLVGEAFMRATSPGQKLAELFFDEAN